MKGLAWFKCDPVAFNDGMMGLTAAERGAYVTILNCIYAQGGPCPDRGAFFGTVLMITNAEWRKIRARLLAARKLQLVTLEGVQCLTNTRAEREIAAYESTVVKRVRAGRRGGLARAAAAGKHLKVVED